GPFLAEERDLIESLAQALKGFLNRTKAERAVAESEGLYHTLADAAHDMVYLKDADGRFTYFNHSAEDLLGEDPDEYVGRKNEDLYSPEVAIQHDTYEAKAGETGEPVYFEELTAFPRKSLWTANWLVPIKGESGQEARVMCVVRDIDGRKRAEQTLLRAEKELESMRQLALRAGQARKELNDCIATLGRHAAADASVDAVAVARATERLKKCAAALKRFPEK
ncbi:MAG TPA: PAS domain S-box protein, partial [Methanocella sp.]|nr:PAS domain S-box protein [Methanocella sp.]